MMQLDMFATAVLEGISKTGTTQGTYQHVAQKLNVPESEVERKVQAGQSGTTSYWKRKVRWIQQNLKKAGLAENGDRGFWHATGKGKRVLTELRRASPWL